MPYDASELWSFLPIGYFLTVALETPVLWFGLSPGHDRVVRLTAAAWLTACTYPIVVLVLPPTIWAYAGRMAYLAVAEIFAPVAECVLFRIAYGASARAVDSPPRRLAHSPSESLEVLPFEADQPGSSTLRTNVVRALSRRRDMLAVVAANLTSFLLGGWLLELWRAR